MHHQHLNDPNELHHGLELGRDIASQLKQNEDARGQFFLDEFVQTFRRETFDKGFEFYIASFSRHRDDLGQWRAYADKGRGFAIGFSRKLFEIVQELPPDKPPEFVGIVKYNIEEMRPSSEAPIYKATELFVSAANANADLIADEKIGRPFMREMIWRLIATLIFRGVTGRSPPRHFGTRCDIGADSQDAHQGYRQSALHPAEMAGAKVGQRR